MASLATPHTTPLDADLRRASDVLNAGEKVAILVGAGALDATHEVIAVAEKLRAGVSKALLGKAALPDDLPYVTGSIGLLGTKPSYRLMTECDTPLIVGSGFPYSEFLPEEGKARGVQIDIAPEMLSLRYPMEVNLVGDAKVTLKALLPLINQKTNGAWRDGIESEVKQWWKSLEQQAMQPANPVNPQRRDLGAVAAPADKPERMGSAWDEALAADRPVVLEVKTDPEVPPLPPHISLEEAKKFTETLRATRTRGTSLILLRHKCWLKFGVLETV